MNDPHNELHNRLIKHKGKIRKILISWNASDGGPRMDVRLAGNNNCTLDEWNDWMILGTRENPGAGLHTIDSIIKETLGSGALNKCTVGAFHRHYEIS